MKNKILSIINKYINVVLFIITIIIALGLSVYFLQEGNYLKLAGETYDILYLIFFVGIFILLKRAYSIKEKRLWICTSILAIIFSIFYLCGNIGNIYCNVTIPNSEKFILYILIKIFTYFIIFDCVLALIFYYAKDFVKKLKINNRNYKLFTANKKSILFVAGIFFISYIPYFLYYYPGILQNDAIYSLEQINGYTQYSNNQSIIYTLLLGGVWNFGKTVLSNGNYGLAIYTIIQMIATSLVLSIIIYYMAKRKIPTKWRIITFLFLLLNPLTAMYAVRIEKSMFFTLAIILVVIGITEIMMKKEEFFKEKSKIIIFAILLLLLSLLRDDGIYVITLTLIAMLIACKKIRIKILTIFIVPIILFLLIQGPVYNNLNVKKLETKESLSIPMQQFARLIKYENKNLMEVEKENIHKYLPVEDTKILSDYQSLISDNIKSDFSEEEINRDKLTLIKTYLKLAFKYPGQTISAFLLNTYGYYSPNSYNVWGVTNFKSETEIIVQNIGTVNLNNKLINEIYEMPVKYKYDIHPRAIINFSYIDRINNHILMKDVPIFSMLITSVGLYFWLLVICITYCIYTKKYKKILIMLPILFLWFISLGGPVVELRYVYSMILLIPLYIGITFIDNKKEEEV